MINHWLMKTLWYWAETDSGEIVEKKWSRWVWEEVRGKVKQINKLLKAAGRGSVENVREAGAERSICFPQITEQTGLISCQCWAVSVSLLWSKTVYALSQASAHSLTPFTSRLMKRQLLCLHGIFTLWSNQQICNYKMCLFFFFYLTLSLHPLPLYPSAKLFLCFYANVMGFLLIMIFHHTSSASGLIHG